MEIKMESLAKVTLTKKGENKLKNDDTATYNKDFNSKTKELETPLWKLFTVFGDNFCMGTMRSPFLRSKIEVVNG